MLDLTIHDIDETLERDLRERASRNNRSLEEEVKFVLATGLKSVSPTDEVKRSPEEIEALTAKIMSYGRRLDEPFDLKAFSDALSDGRE